MKKLLIALLGINALLIALLTAQAAQAKVKTYDAVKLAEYSACIEKLPFTDFYNAKLVREGICSQYKP